MRETNTSTAHLPGLLRRGFTLIELLVVIAVLGILAAVVLVALDPLEQITRGRDAGKINTVAQVGHALQAYATSQSGTYPPTTGWQAALISTGDLKQEVSVSTTSSDCTTNNTGNICYNLVDGDVVVWTVLESKNSKQKAGNCADATIAIYSTLKGQAGIACVANVSSVDPDETIL